MLYRVLSLLVIGLFVSLATVQAQESVACEQTVVVQADDWLSRIAERVYGDPAAYPAIVEATQAIAVEDDTFATIENPDTIEVGWKLCIPSAADAEVLLAPDTAAPAAVSAEPVTSASVGRLVLATTTSTYDSGLLQAILPAFEAQYDATVEAVAVGTGQALELGRNGDADVVLVHARTLEDEFVAEGYGVNRQDVMYNDFVIVGPPNDPAGIRGMTDVAAALGQLAATESQFVSRGDNSGTHNREQALWEASGLDLTETESGYTQPIGEWYLSIGQGMGATLTLANEQLAYTLTDRGTFLSRQLEGIDLEIMVEGDSRLFNPYGVIAVNAELHPNVNAAGAAAFIDWLTSIETQAAISEYGTDTFGMPLFVPDSLPWNAAQAN